MTQEGGLKNGKILPPDYTMTRYGLFARFVTLEDAEFILSLRVAQKSKYLSPVDNDIEKQRAWLREYKKREAQGLDYYFIFYEDGVPVGLDRLYDFNGKEFSSGSWVFAATAPFGCAFLACVMVRELAFYDLGFDYERVPQGVHVDNVNVKNFDFKMIGMKDLGRVQTPMGEFISLGLSKDDFEKGRKKILSLLRIPYVSYK